MAKNTTKTRASKATENSEGESAAAAKPDPAAPADAAGISSGAEDLSARDASSGGTVEPGPGISVPTLDELVAAAPGAIDALDERLKAEEEQFRKAYPRLAAVIDAWQAAGKGQPQAVRITAKRDGFRRAGMAHSKAAAEHPIESFRLPEQLEQLLGESNLVVELI